jgi:hypothetical protein
MASIKRQKHFCMMLAAVVFLSVMLMGCSILTQKEDLVLDEETAALETSANQENTNAITSVPQTPDQEDSIEGSADKSLKEPANKQEISEDKASSDKSTSWESEQGSNKPSSGSDEAAIPEEKYYSFITAEENGPIKLEDYQLKYTAVEKSISFKDMDGNRIITALWPYFIHEDSEEVFAPANNAILDEYVIYIINDFIETTDEGAAEGMTGPFLLEINYRLEFTSTRLVSVMVHYYTFEGGAHPSTMNYSYNYDIKEKNQLLLYGGMFSDGFDFLDFLSLYCYEDIRRQYTELGVNLADVDSWIKDGTDPSEPENFENFYFTADAFAVHFDQYEVGPYVAGPFTVMIPYEKFEGNLLFP